MRPAVRGVLVGAGVMAACLAALWLSVVGGTWLAIATASGSAAAGRIAGGLVLAGALVILARAVSLLVGDLRPERRR